MSDGSSAELNLGLLLFIPYRAMEARVLAALTASGRDDITLAQAASSSGSARAAPGSPILRSRRR